MIETKDDEYIILSRSGMRDSTKTSGRYFTLMTKNLRTGRRFIVWPDTSFRNYKSWSEFDKDDIFSGVEAIEGEYKKNVFRLNCKAIPVFVRHFEKPESKQTKMFEEEE